MSKMPDFIPEDLPEFILFAVVGVDPRALAADEIPDTPDGRKAFEAAEAEGGIGFAVQSTLNCDPRLVAAALRALAATLDRDAREERAARN